jgi:hypothetical protein
MPELYRKISMYKTGRLYLLKNSAIIARTFLIAEEVLTLDDQELPAEDDDTPDILYNADHRGRREC